MYVPKSLLTEGTMGAWSLCLLAGERAGGSDVVELTWGGD